MMFTVTRRSVSALAFPLASLVGCAAADITPKDSPLSEVAVVRLTQLPRASQPDLKEYPRATIFRAMGLAAPGSKLPLAVPAGPLDLVVRCEVQLGYPGSETERSFTPVGGPTGFSYIEVERQVVVEAGRTYEPQCFKVDGGWSARLSEILPGT